LKAQGQNAVAEKAYTTLRGELLEEIQALIDCKDNVIVPTADQIKLCQYKFFSLSSGMTRSCLSPSSLRSLGETNATMKRGALDDLTWTRTEATGTPAEEGLVGRQRALQIEAMRGGFLGEQGEEAGANDLQMSLKEVGDLEAKLIEVEEAKRFALVLEDFIAAQEAKLSLVALTDQMELLFSRAGVGKEDEAAWRTSGSSPPATRHGALLDGKAAAAAAAGGSPPEAGLAPEGLCPGSPPSLGSQLPAVPGLDEF